MARASRTRAARPAGERRAGSSRRAAAPTSRRREPTPARPRGSACRRTAAVDDHPAYRRGLVEVQDEGSQLIALACAPQPGETRGRPVRRRRRQDAGAWQRPLRAPAPRDRHRSRAPVAAGAARRAGGRGHRDAGCSIRRDELEALADWRGKADVVLIDAPCSGSGTWRRNPEARWRLTPERLDRLAAHAGAAARHRCRAGPAGRRLVYAVCSLLSREGAGQIERFLERHSSWISEETAIAGGRADGAGRLLTPGHDRYRRLFRRAASGAHARRQSVEVEILMRSLPRLLLVGFAGVALASPVLSQRADDQIEPKSIELQRQAKALIAAGKLEEADDVLETALAVDPRNRAAFVDLARVAEKQHLSGKAIRMTTRRCCSSPTTPTRSPSRARRWSRWARLLARRQNLQKLQTLCGAKACPQAAQLSAAISRGPTVASAKAPASSEEELAQRPRELRRIRRR